MKWSKKAKLNKNPKPRECENDCSYCDKVIKKINFKYYLENNDGKQTKYSNTYKDNKSDNKQNHNFEFMKVSNNEYQNENIQNFIKDKEPIDLHLTLKKVPRWWKLYPIFYIKKSKYR